MGIRVIARCLISDVGSARNLGACFIDCLWRRQVSRLSTVVERVCGLWAASLFRRCGEAVPLFGSSQDLHMSSCACSSRYSGRRSCSRIFGWLGFAGVSGMHAIRASECAHAGSFPANTSGVICYLVPVYFFPRPQISLLTSSEFGARKNKTF